MALQGLLKRSAHRLLAFTGIVLACSLLVILPVQAQTRYAGPQHPIGDVAFSDPLHGWATSGETDQGFLFRTDDGGNSWKRVSTPDGFYRVFFLNAKLGWGLSVDLSDEQHVRFPLYVSHDGGSSWSYLSTIESRGPNPARIITSFRFIDEKHGWFVGDCSGGVGIALQTSDGGYSFREVDGISGNDSLEGVYALAPSKVWIFGANLIAASFDAGRTWKAQLDEEHTVGGYRDLILSSGVVSSTGVGWVVGTGPAILKTTDFGRTWQVALERKEHWFTDISFWNPDQPCAVGASTRLDCTLDGGRSWISHELPTKEVHGSDIYTRILFTSAERCWVLDDGWLFRSEDAGGSWQAVDFSGALAGR